MNLNQGNITECVSEILAKDDVETKDLIKIRIIRNPKEKKRVFLK